MDIENKHAHIEGWGADLDHKNRPAYPKERMPARLEGVHWDQPEQQPLKVKVFHSNERPATTPIFGTSTPPSGLSGRMREFAFKYSENDIRHWLVLMLADRVNMIEGLGEDLSKGHVPNILAEMGAKAEWQHNRKSALKKAAIAVGVVGFGVYLWRRRRA